MKACLLLSDNVHSPMEESMPQLDNREAQLLPKTGSECRIDDQSIIYAPKHFTDTFSIFFEKKPMKQSNRLSYLYDMKNSDRSISAGRN